MIPKVACSKPDIGSALLGERSVLRNVQAGSYNALAYYATLDGSDDCIALSTPGYAAGTSRTIFATVRSTQSGTSKYILDSSVRSIFAWNTNATGKLGYFDGSSWISFGDAPDDGEWHNIALVLDGTTCRAFVDGTQLGTDGSCAAVDISASVTTAIGGFHGAIGASVFGGDMAYVAIFDTALTAAEIIQVANSRHACGASKVLEWQFDDSDGTTVSDSSGNDNDGTATNVTQSTFWNPYTGA